MTTKYDIGDVLKVIDYYDEICCSDIVEITILSNETWYTLSNKIVVSEISKDNDFYKLIGKVGNINNMN